MNEYMNESMDQLIKEGMNQSMKYIHGSNS